jgi:hypothetical protein
MLRLCPLGSTRGQVTDLAVRWVDATAPPPVPPNEPLPLLHLKHCLALALGAERLLRPTEAVHPDLTVELAATAQVCLDTTPKAA